MRAVVQRVETSKVSVDNNIVGEIGAGLMVLLGIGEGDSPADIDYLVEKIINLRVFSDKDGKMNLSLLDIAGDLMVIPQFTLYGDCRKGRRPSYGNAASPQVAKQLYKQFLEQASHSVNVTRGVFGAHMQIELINDGPVTLLLDSNRVF